MSEQEVTPPSEITFDDFIKVDLRIGLIKAAESVPKSDKLIKLQVSFGSYERTILAGIGKTFIPENLVGKEYLFVVNLAPRKIMGTESHGMMLAAGDELDKLSLVTHSSDGTLAGARAH
jgi:methionyl-tRNA synthetase